MAKTKTPEQNNEIMNYVCERMAEGKSLRESITKVGEDGKKRKVCSFSYFFKLVREFPLFGEQYAYACEEKNSFFLHKLIEIAENELPTAEITDQVGGENSYTKTVIKDNIGRSKLQIDTIKWFMAKTQPKLYGNAPDAGEGGSEEQPLFPDLHENE